MKAFSQYGQDVFLDSKVFKGKEKGVFVDIGAHDGITYSNTAFFERYRNWKGLCIEPNPTVFSQLVKVRPHSTNLNVCISSNDKIVEFYQVDGYAEMLSGIKSSYQKDHFERLKREVKENGGTINVVNVISKPLKLILTERQMSQIDYVSIDVEGGEISVLESINFEDVYIDVFSIENNYDKVEIRNFMKKNNYSLIKKLHCDEIYRKKKKRFFFFHA